MGNDGGSIPTRRELVKQGAKDLSTTQVKEIQTEQQEHYWSTCALSHQPLAQPVVSDALGTLYNKDAIIAHLLGESQRESPTSIEELAQKKETFKDRIRSLRDVVEVRFHTNAEDSSGNQSSGQSKWACPVTNKVLGPGTKAVYIVPCGHAFAESLISTVPGEKCLECDEPYESENVIPILPTSQQSKDDLTQRLENLKAKGLTHSLKKRPKDSTGGGSKKRKKAGPSAPEASVNNEHNTPTSNGNSIETTSRPNDPDTGTSTSISGIQNRDTATLTEKVLKEQEDRHKRRKMAGGNENVQSLFSKGDSMEAKKVDFMTRGFSIPANGIR